MDRRRTSRQLDSQMGAHRRHLQLSLSVVSHLGQSHGRIETERERLNLFFTSSDDAGLSSAVDFPTVRGWSFRLNGRVLEPLVVASALSTRTLHPEPPDGDA
jgi:hypothetical protein